MEKSAEMLYSAYHDTNSLGVVHSNTNDVMIRRWSFEK